MSKEKKAGKQTQSSESSMFDILVDDEEKARKQKEKEQIRQRQIEKEKHEKGLSEKTENRFQEVKKTKGCIAVRDNNTAVVNPDGTVDIVGDTSFIRKCNTSDWRDIVQVNLAREYVMGLKRDGTVVTAGSSPYYDISKWRDIIAVSSGGSGSCGLKADGTVVTANYPGGKKDEINRWQDIVALSAGSFLTVGVKKDGTVVTSGHVLDPDAGKDNVEISSLNWRDIVSVSVNDCDVVGIKSNGTVVIAGSKTVEHSEIAASIADWRDIIAIDSTANCIVGLKRNGCFSRCHCLWKGGRFFRN